MINAAKLLEWVEGRAILRGECWVWTMALGHGTTPQGKLDSKTINVRRALYECRTGQPMAINCFAVCSCETVGCVRPDHIIARTRSASQKGRPLSAPHKLAIAKARRIGAKLDDAKVAEIRDSDEPGPVLALRYGISKDYVNQLKAHIAWRDHGSPFAQLGARA